MSMNETQEIKW